MIVRELIAILGIKLDDSDVKKVDNQVTRFGDRMQKLGQIVGGTIFLAGLARAGAAVVGFASDAEETLNLVRETFGANAADVEAWSTRVAKDVGRSEFLMREMAGTLGAVLTPLMQGNTQASADMSTGLATLAVDLGSFFNAAESDVLVALRAGIVGEAEPLKRFGIVMLESTLQAFALAQGITKSVKSMSIAEKTTLRYNFILDQTVIAQGDAARTADGYANATRAAADGVKDLATRIGTRLLPVATRFMVWTRDAARSLVEVTQKSNIVESALLVLAGALGVVGVMMLAPFLPFLITAAKVLLIIGAITIVTDELITFFKGGKTVIGEFIDAMFGLGSAQLLLDSLKTGWEIMDEAMLNSVTTLREWSEAFGEDMDAAGVAFGKFKDDWVLGIDAMFGDGAVKKAGEFFDKITEFVVKFHPFLAVPRALGLLDEAGGANVGFGTKTDVLSAAALNEIRTRRTAVGAGISARSVGARQGSTGRDVRLARARQLAAKERLTKTERLEQSRITAGPVTVAERATAPARVPAAPVVSTPINASITINEASNPEVVRRAVQKGITDAVADAGASTARGVR